MAAILFKQQQQHNLRDLYIDFVNDRTHENYEALIGEVIKNYDNASGKFYAVKLYGDTHPGLANHPDLSQKTPTIEQLRDLIYDETSFKRFSSAVKELVV